jgi:DNA-binding NtrC family response regulator
MFERQSQTSTKPTVLVAEDEPLLRDLLQDALSDAGFEVLLCENGDLALDAIRTRPDLTLLITDIVMPGLIDGLDLARAATGANPPLPVIVTSGFTERTDLLEALRDTVNFCPKPYDTTRLVALATTLALANASLRSVAPNGEV